jgi:hypothetical protein
MECVVSVRNFIIVMKYYPGIYLRKELYHGDPRTTRLRSERFGLIVLFALCHICCPFTYNFLCVYSYMYAMCTFGMPRNALQNAQVEMSLQPSR